MALSYNNHACVLVIVFLTNCSALTRKFVNYNSSDLSYLSNGIQIPVLPFMEQDPILELEPTHLPEMEWLLQLYNHHKWENRTEFIENDNCKSHILTYLNALKNGTAWAAKMNDASGRYSSQFFFGNDYWLGSSTLCKELNIPDGYTEMPPFPLHFYVAKVRVNINEVLTPVTRQINLGQCLPSSCTVTDVRRLLVQEHPQGKSLAVVGVRAVPGSYSLLQDYKFYLIGGIGVLISLIIVVATVFDYQTHNTIKEDSSKETNNNNNNNNNIKNHSDILKIQHEIKNVNAEERKSNTELYKKILLSFSSSRNGKTIINVDPLSKDSIKCIHGFRFFSVCWIILVHTYLEVFAIAANKSMRIVTERTFLYQTIANAAFAVDTFFFISGLLVTIGYLKRESKPPIVKNNDSENKANEDVKGSITKFCKILFQRYIRLTPAYLFVLGVNELVMRYFHNNSVFSPAIIDHISCKEYWWRNALYINNFFPQHEFCMLWTWYMANDMQFFVMAIILLGAAVRSEKCLKFVSATIFIFLISSWITTFTIAMHFKYIARIEEPFALFDQLYDKPWLHIGPYLIGMCTGYLLLRIDFKMVLPKYIVTPCWIVTMTCLISLVYGIGKEGLIVPASAFYASLGHTAWSVGLAWITVACCTGYGGIVSDILNFRGFLPFSRLSYCAYLIHPVLMCTTSFQLDGPINLHYAIMIVVYFGNVVMSFAGAFLISLAFEAPFVHLLKLLK